MGIVVDLGGVCQGKIEAGEVAQAGPIAAKDYVGGDGVAAFGDAAGDALDGDFGIVEPEEDEGYAPAAGLALAQESGVADAGAGCFKGERGAGAGEGAHAVQHNSAGGDCGAFGVKGREAGGDVVGVDEFEQAEVFRQDDGGGGGFAGTVGAANDDDVFQLRRVGPRIQEIVGIGRPALFHG